MLMQNGVISYCRAFFKIKMGLKKPYCLFCESNSLFTQPALIKKTK